jgi:hypothetical protein
VGLLESSEVDQWNWRSWSWSGRGAKPAVVDTAEGGVTAGARVTFRSAGKPGGTVDVGASDGVGNAGKPSGIVGVGAGDSVGYVLETVAKMLTNCWSAVTWLSLARESGEAGDGCRRAAVKLLECGNLAVAR